TDAGVGDRMTTGAGAMGRRRRRLLLGGAIVLALTLPIVRYVNRSDVAHQAIQTRLQVYGSGIYEYHSKTGQWPSRIDNLAQTSLPQRFPSWKQIVDDGVIVPVWHKNLKPDPGANAGLVLAYHNKGLYARMGRVW